MEDPTKSTWRGTRDTCKLTPRKTFLMVTDGRWWKASLGIHPWPGKTPRASFCYLEILGSPMRFWQLLSMEVAAVSLSEQRIRWGQESPKSYLGVPL